MDILKGELAFSINFLYFEAYLDTKWPFLGVFSCSRDRLLIYFQKKLKNCLSGLILKTPFPNLEGELSFAQKLTLLSQISQICIDTLSEKMIYPATSTNTGYIIFSESVVYS